MCWQRRMHASRYAAPQAPCAHVWLCSTSGALLWEQTVHQLHGDDLNTELIRTFFRSLGTWHSLLCSTVFVGLQKGVLHRGCRHSYVGHGAGSCAQLMRAFFELERAISLSSADPRTGPSTTPLALAA